MFDGLELVRKALDEAYGKDKVSLVSAAFRWMNHHSQLKDNGMCSCIKLSRSRENYVEPLNKDTFGTSRFVLCREVVLFFRGDFLECVYMSTFGL